MTFVLGVVVSLLVSYLVVIVPRGMSPAMPEFWVMPILYGAPVLLLAWPIYLQVFKRLRRWSWWQLGLIGAALSPLPFAVLLVVSGMLSGTLFDGTQPLFFYFPWNSVFTYWYAMFGLLLGMWVGARRKPRVTRNTPT